MADLRDASRRLNRIARKLVPAERRLVELNGADLYDTARRFTSGSLQPKDLARMDHPYATRHGSPRLNPGYLNIRTGGVFNAWHLEFRRTASGRMAVVFNTDPKAHDFLEPGTRRMFARAVAEQVMANARPRLEARCRIFVQTVTR